jgi:hypothetical protein
LIRFRASSKIQFITSIPVSCYHVSFQFQCHAIMCPFNSNVMLPCLLSNPKSCYHVSVQFQCHAAMSPVMCLRSIPFGLFYFLRDYLVWQKWPHLETARFRCFRGLFPFTLSNIYYVIYSKRSFVTLSSSRDVTFCLHIFIHFIVHDDAFSEILELFQRFTEYKAQNDLSF